MKTITLSAATLTLAATVLTLMLSGQAQASSPKARFDSMRKAVVARAKTEGSAHTFSIGSVSVHKDSAWVVVDDNMVEVVGFRSSNEGTGDKHLHAPSKKAMKISLDPKAYKSIDFGKNHDTLVLTTVGKPDRYVVSLDHKSNLPTSVQMEHSAKGGWMIVPDGNFEGNPKH